MTHKVTFLKPGNFEGYCCYMRKVNTQSVNGCFGDLNVSKGKLLDLVFHCQSPLNDVKMFTKDHFDLLVIFFCSGTNTKGKNFSIYRLQTNVDPRKNKH